ncbi:hypothetical protein [Georgenia faecalis]|uniref:hypothetical protein n=1 Tax=Georgenia faecalis TaxID=2483799 RepID=UPI000FD703DB|nr:hypothetical protein [Georgenia faecalis]
MTAPMPRPGDTITTAEALADALHRLNDEGTGDPIFVLATNDVAWMAYAHEDGGDVGFGLESGDPREHMDDEGFYDRLPLTFAQYPVTVLYVPGQPVAPQDAATGEAPQLFAAVEVIKSRFLEHLVDHDAEDEAWTVVNDLAAAGLLAQPAESGCIECGHTDAHHRRGHCTGSATCECTLDAPDGDEWRAGGAS